ncbi:MAG: hypothetical protein Lokiarch_20150 [Candidatus Lokiarchaeum sp. GC14_75]|nr:MAG: hypothetical protein Lokiarch_20150 [Candidatus Lokiarchaeum sp. GC14_75]
MEEFLQKLQLSNNAIEIYLKSVGKYPLTYNELYSIVPKSTPEEFEEYLTQLINGGLMLQIIPKKQEKLLHYQALPPILPIISYYENITTNLSAIKNSIQELLLDRVHQTFQQENPIELDSMLKTFQETRKDIEEDIIIQKQEVEDIVEGMEELKKIEGKLSVLKQQIKGGTQTLFASLLRNISDFKSELTDKINALEFKKHKQEIISIIEQIFTEKLDLLLEDFSNTLYDTVEKEFEGTKKPVDNLINTGIQNRDDFKLILLNMLNNFETKMNKIYEIIKENRETLSNKMKNLELKITGNLNEIVQNSVEEVSNLNKPVENLMKGFYSEMKVLNSKIPDIWFISSQIKLKEEIQKSISTSKEDLILIVPHLDNFITVDQFEKLPKSLKLKVVSSEPHTNSSVKKFTSITNLAYRTLENNKFIALRGDKTNFVIGVILQDAKDSLYDFIGIGSNSKEIIEVMDPILSDTWKNAFSDTFYATQKAQAKTVTSRNLESSKSIKAKTIDEIHPVKEVQVNIRKVEEKKIAVISAKNLSESPAKIKNITQELREKITFTASPIEKKGDKDGLLIVSNFNTLIQNLNNLKGEYFSRELQKIADLVLERRGFSVTLHKLRSLINKYRYNEGLLEAEDKKEIIENIEEWKIKLG